MLKNFWYPILDKKEVKPGMLTGVTRLGRKLAIWRDNSGTLNCIEDKCCHRGASLSTGKINDGHASCPFHGFRYDGTGRCVLIPANGKASPVPPNFKVEGFIVCEKHDFIWLWNGEKRADLPEIPFFDNYSYSLSYAKRVDLLPMHYTRAIENQLDVVHLPFVHHNTIGKGNRTLVNGPLIEPVGKEGFAVFVDNRVDAGQLPLGAAEISPRKMTEQHIHFIFPGVWQNYINDKLRIVIFFVPVDEDNTLIYMRYYQKMVKVPLIRELFNYAGIYFSKIILFQDNRVVVTQLPKKTWLTMSENLIKGDSPIVLFRKMHDEFSKKVEEQLV